MVDFVVAVRVRSDSGSGRGSGFARAFDCSQRLPSLLCAWLRCLALRHVLESIGIQPPILGLGARQVLV